MPFLAVWPGKIKPRVEDRAIQSLVDIAPTFLDAAGVEIPHAMQGVSQAAAWTSGQNAPRDWAIVENHHHRARVHLRGARITRVLGQPVPPADVGPGDPLAILYTSGTTGPAKGVVCPHAQYYWWGVNSAAILGIGPDDVLGTTLPLFHINALNTFAQALVTGCQVVYEPRFSASGFWPAMRASGATVVYLLGAMVPILLAQPPDPRERHHRVRIGLGPGVPPAAGAAFRERTGVRLLEGYGSTETNFVIATALNGRHMGALLNAFDRDLANDGVKSLRTEGDSNSGWVLVDFGAVIVHLFTPEDRDFYRLEQLWSRAGVPAVRFQ